VKWTRALQPRFSRDCGFGGLCDAEVTVTPVPLAPSRSVAAVKPSRAVAARRVLFKHRVWLSGSAAAADTRSFSLSASRPRSKKIPHSEVALRLVEPPFQNKS